MRQSFFILLWSCLLLCSGCSSRDQQIPEKKVRHGSGVVEQGPLVVKCSVSDKDGVAIINYSVHSRDGSPLRISSSHMIYLGVYSVYDSLKEKNWFQDRQFFSIDEKIGCIVRGLTHLPAEGHVEFSDMREYGIPFGKEVAVRFLFHTIRSDYETRHSDCEIDHSDDMIDQTIEMEIQVILE